MPEDALLAPLLAHWSCFFDALSEPYIRDLPAVSIATHTFAPRFYLPRLRTWVNVLPNPPAEQHTHAAERLAQLVWVEGHPLSVVLPPDGRCATCHDLWIIVGAPLLEVTSTGAIRSLPYDIRTPFTYLDDDADDDRIDWDHNLIVMCAQCQHILVESRSHHLPQFAHEGGRHGTCCTTQPGNPCTTQLRAAYAAARQLM